MHHGTVSSADRLSQGVIAWPQVRRIQQVKNRAKKKNAKKSAPAAGRGTPSPPRMDTLWGPRAGPERAQLAAARHHLRVIEAAHACYLHVQPPRAQEHGDGRACDVSCQSARAAPARGLLGRDRVQLQLACCASIWDKSVENVPKSVSRVCCSSAACARCRDAPLAGSVHSLGPRECTDPTGVSRLDAVLEMELQKVRRRA